MGPTLLGSEKFFKIKVLRRLKKAIFRWGFWTYSTSQDSHIANLLSKMHKKRFRYYIVYGVYFGPTMVGS